MPQMSARLWMNIYITFSITLVIFIAMFFYTKTPNPAPESISAPIKQSLSWKW